MAEEQLTGAAWHVRHLHPPVVTPRCRDSGDLCTLQRVAVPIPLDLFRPVQVLQALAVCQRRSSGPVP